MALNPGPRRGELVTIAVSGDDGKPRPALVIQADAFAQLPSRAKLGSRIGRLEADGLRSVERALQAFLGLEDPARVR